jgi:hypothetical protein
MGMTDIINCAARDCEEPYAVMFSWYRVIWLFLKARRLLFHFLLNAIKKPIYARAAMVSVS